MLKKTITYTDYNDVQHTEEFYFNLSESELARMEMYESTIHGETIIGGMQKRLNDIVKSGSGRKIMETFEGLIRDSYGVRSEDGKRFIKNEKVVEEFMQSAAYDVFFMELVTDANLASEFVNAIIPKGYREGGSKEAARKPQDFQKPKENTGLSVVSDKTIDVVEEYEDSDRKGGGNPSSSSEWGPEGVPNLTPEELELIRNKRKDN